MTFATFDAASYSIDEDKEELRIPVTIVNPTGAEYAVSFKTIDGKAQENVDYEIISPVSGVLNFAPGETTQEIVLGLNYDETLTGTKDFSLSISSATEGFIVGGCDLTKIRLKDVNHPLRPFIGEWAASVKSYTGLTYAWSMVIDADESDLTYTKLLVSDLEPFAAVYCKFNAENGYNVVDAVSNSAKTEITVAYDSYIATDEEGAFFKNAGTVLSVCGLDAPTLDAARTLDDVVIKKSEDGSTLIIANALCCLADGQLADLVEGPIVFTKK